jgi:hypothetical protein
MVPLALLVAAGTAGTLIALGAAQRTSTAYDRYATRSNVGDLQINPSLPTKEIDTLIRSLPGVEQVTTHDLLAVVGGPEAHGGTAAEADAGQIRGSVDGRYLRMDRPAVRTGHLPTGRHQAFLDDGFADFYGLHVGSVIPLTFAPSAAQLPGYEPPPDAPPPRPSTIHVRVVGIGTLPDEVLPDGLYPRQRAIVSPDVAERYDCKPEPLPADGTYSQVIDAVFPAGCAINYRYYSLSIRGGARGVRAAQDAFVRRGSELNRALPRVLRDQQLGYELIPTTTARDRDRIERATRPTVTALTVLGLAVGLVTVLVVAIAVGRELRRSSTDQLQWWHLGLTASQRATVVATPLLAGVLVGALGALPVAFVFSTLAPVGNVRRLEPSPAHTLSSWSWLAAVAIAGVLVVGLAALAWLWSRRVGRRPRPERNPSFVGRLLDRTSRPGVGAGARAAFARERGPGFVVASGALAVGVLITAIVFGAGLTELVRTPRAYGWPWDVAVVTNYGYGGVLRTAVVDRALEARDDVEGWTTLAFSNSTAVDGEPVPSIIVAGDHLPDRGIQVDEGRLPASAHEVALGATTAARHHVRVGDSVRVNGRGVAARRATVTGLVVVPSLGPFESDRPSPGDGMVMPGAMVDAGYLDTLVSFVGIKTTAGTDPTDTLASIRRSYKRWGVDDLRVDVSQPIRPPEIVDAQSVRSIPLLVGGLLGVSLVLGLSMVVAASVRARRRELAMLRTLGFTGGQLRTSVRVQAAATMLAALLIGVPLGIVAGRLAWRAFASGLAVVLPPATPVLGLALTTIGALAAVVITATVPALLAGRAAPATTLRTE